jgi:hypothetical protein
MIDLNLRLGGDAQCQAGSHRGFAGSTFAAGYGNDHHSLLTGDPVPCLDRAAQRRGWEIVLLEVALP